ncbi:hypothetical protein M441DRAFT_48659 [Trichoderma asperellum CBS 433.97]|uniref:F-box domain-containing protein n=2 Tax=Trichoderma asperellum TaxID=101201 RepID=A0A2T3Z3X8_TRIA4|nr:hypothetical protein M441DRAFT_48659 [Trichoderma asperellum CBS 433.97]PTB39504.1 hypothetical protein M441DRAFT_48659 [Trichoderma asperellum CBS 433.97]
MEDFAATPLSEISSSDLIHAFGASSQKRVPPAQPWSRIHPSSLFGIFDSLPNSTVKRILSLLDVQSLTRVARTCTAGARLMQTLPAYVDMLKHAPRILRALGQTNLLKHHSIALLTHVLRNDGRCCACKRRFGGYMFLPTADRVCRICVKSDPCFQMVPYPMLLRYGVLTHSQRYTLPVMRVHPAYFVEMLGEERFVPQYLVSIKDVGLHKMLPIRHRLDAAAQEQLFRAERRYTRGFDTTIRYPVNSHFPLKYVDSPEALQHQDFDSDPQQLYRAEGDNYPGRAYIKFPNVSSKGNTNRTERGILCLGCWHAYELLCDRANPDRVSDLCPPFMLIRDQRLINRDQLLRKGEFREHVIHCPGIQGLLEEWQQGTQRWMPGSPQ